MRKMNKMQLGWPDGNGETGYGYQRFAWSVDQTESSIK
jgi:hypothetical protein